MSDHSRRAAGVPTGPCPGPGWELAIDPEDPYGPTRHDFDPVLTPKWRRIPPERPVPTNPTRPAPVLRRWDPHRQRFTSDYHDGPPEGKA